MMELLYKTFAFDISPCGMCHASSVLAVDENRLLCAFFAGSYEGNADTGIYLAVLRDGKPYSLNLVAASDEAHWNPVLFYFEDGRIGLIFKVGNVIASWRSYLSVSSDGGETFCQPIELVKGDFGGRGPVRNKPLRLKSGRVLCPASLENGIWRAFVDISDDDFKTFNKSAEIIADPALSQSQDAGFQSGIEVSSQSFSGRGIIQPSLWEDPLGVHMLLRSTFGVVMRSDSSDNGQSWSKPYPVKMPNNNSGLDLDVHQGLIYLVCNPVAGNWASRSPLVLFSSDDGINFTQERVLESENDEFSYPCVRCQGNFMYVSYTWKRKNIRILKFKFIDSKQTL